MKAPRLKAFLSIAVIAFADRAVAGDHWLLSVTGGEDSTHRDMYEKGFKAFGDVAKAFESDPKRSFNYFGFGPYRGYFSNLPENAEKIRANRGAFLKSNPPNCALAEEIFSVMVSEAPKRYRGNAAFVEKTNPATVKKIRDAYRTERQRQRDSAKEAGKNAVDDETVLEEVITRVTGMKPAHAGNEQTLRMILADLVRSEGKSDVVLDGTLTDPPELRSGAADMANLEAALKAVISGSKPGDHLLFNLDDHGIKWDEQKPAYYTISLGARRVRLKDTELRDKWMPQLKKKGVVVHLNANACFSGGFAALTDASRQGGVCTTSSADPDLVAMGSDELIPVVFGSIFNENLARYGSQLEAFACSLVDQWNRPNNSLDHIVKAWERKRKIKAQTGVEDCKTASDLYTEITGRAKAIEDSLAEPLRVDLARDYRKHFIERKVECASRYGDPKNPGKPQDAVLKEKLLSCLPRSRALNAEYKQYVKDLLTVPAGDEYAGPMMAGHLRFIEKAEFGELMKFKNAFCCLGYDFKTKQAPEVCR